MLISEAQARHARARCILKRYLRRKSMHVMNDIDDQTLIEYSKLVYRISNLK